MDLLKLQADDVSRKIVLLRLDLDVDDDFSRIESAKETLSYLKSNESKVVVLGHKGRPEGKADEKYSLSRLATIIENVVGIKIGFSKEIVGDQVKDRIKNQSADEMIL